MKSVSKFWPLLPAAVALVLHAWRYDYVSDDTFIGLRYVRNFIEGHGLVFNIGERVEGFTSLLWLLLITPFGLAGADLLLTARVMGLLCALGLLIVVTLLAQSAVEGPAWLHAVPAFIVALNAPVACWALTGMESPCFALSVVLSVWLVIRICGTEGSRSGSGQAIVAGLVAGMTVVVRPEGLIVGVVLCAVLLVRPPGRDRTRGAAFALGLVFVVALQLLWRRWYFGDWLPNTYYAKVGGWSLAMLERGWSYLRSYAMGFGGLGFFFVPFAAAVWRRDRFWWTVAGVAAALLAAIVYVGGDGLAMYRFLVPVVPLWSILVLTLLVDLRRWTMRRLGEHRRPVVLVAIGLLAAAIALLGIVPRPHDDYYLYYDYQKTHEVPLWTMVGKWLKEKAQPGDSLACVPIGAIGYYSGLPLYDMLGLTDRHIARREQVLGEGRAGHEKHDGPYILSRKPTFLLLGNVRVVNEPMDPAHPEFVRVRVPRIEDREYDIYTSELAEEYVPQFAQLPDGRYLNFVYRKERWLERIGAGGEP